MITFWSRSSLLEKKWTTKIWKNVPVQIVFGVMRKKKYDRSECPASFESRPWLSRNTFRRWWSLDIPARSFVFRKFLKGPKKFWAHRSREFGSKTSSSRAPPKMAERDRRWQQPEIEKIKNCTNRNYYQFGQLINFNNLNNKLYNDLWQCHKINLVSSHHFWNIFPPKIT